MSALAAASLIVAAVALLAAAALGVLLVRTRRAMTGLASTVRRLQEEPPPPSMPGAELRAPEPAYEPVALPTSEQVRRAALAQPVVRMAAVLHGLRYALRPESRDRLAALVRREYRRRRKLRASAGKQAARAADVQEAA